MSRKTWKKFFAAVFAAVCLPLSSLSIPAEAQAADVAKVSVETDGSTVTIGNGYISREFSTAGNKLSTIGITNKRTDNGETVFTPAAGSEEFKIRIAKVVPSIDKSGWTAYADSYQNENSAENGNASNLIDGNTATFWHSKYDNTGVGGQGSTSFPYNVVFNLGKATTFQCFSYTPRSISVNANGNLKGYELYYATDESELEIGSDKWQLLKAGEFTYDGVNTIYVNLDSPCTATQLKLKALSAKNGQNFGGGAEFSLHKQKVEEMPSDEEREFAASALTLKGSPQIEDTEAVINDIPKTGKKMIFEFQPYTFRNVEYTIREVIVMYDGDHFMRKYMEISVPEDQKSDAVIDYIDLESLVTNQSDATWTIPTDAGGVVAMDRFRSNLGQPIYIQGMFFGCEFPVADNEIVNNTGYMRYYTGKSFSRMELDNQLTQDGKYVTWQTVAGAARSMENEVIQADFFEYIKSIATPSEFRIQYNSWFDNMMYISDGNIRESFIEIDRELNQAEVRPLDSYVVDDGWVNYNKTAMDPESDRAKRAGTTQNKTGFWEFNDKFPEGLTLSSNLVHTFGSNFGVWVGPRGGYNFYGDLADIMAAAGTGSKAGGAIDVADRTYVKNFTDMTVKWMEDYGVNYWKWDGFADNDQYNTFAAADGVPGYANRHMTGGYNHMYHVTDLWEAWIDLMETVRRCEKENNIKNLWISLTCYVNPSPWYLQWANSVWIQCLYDQRDAGSSESKMDRQITYRDATYYDFLKNHEFQFPLSNIYNHDPVYGVEGTGMNLNTATDEQFKNYLYMLSTRGTAFWELYFSDSIMTPGKYQITGEFLEWAEENYHMLKNSKMFGVSPHAGVVLGDGVNESREKGAYGYSCFDGTDGIISFRNAATAPKTITVNFDRTIGVPEDAGTLKYHIEHSHNLTADTPATGELTYGDQIQYTLQPDEVRILRVSKAGDTKAPEFTRAYSDGENQITVKLNEKGNAGTFKVNGTAVAAEAGADGRTFYLTVEESVLEASDGREVTVTAEDLHDLAGNTMTENTVSFIFHKKNTVLRSMKAIKGQVNVQDAKDSLTGNNGFTVSADVYTKSTGAVLSQGGEYEIGIREDGTAYFELNGAIAVSTTTVNDNEGHLITGVKENNGMIKIYIDGQLEGAGYKKENRYYEVKAADVIAGNAAFEGIVTAKTSDADSGYDDVIQDNGDPETPVGPQNWAAKKPVTAAWAADGSNAAGNADRPMSMVTDGTKNNGNYGEFGEDGRNESLYLQIDLGEVKEISKINLYRYWDGGRTYNGTVIALSKTENFAEKDIIYNSDKENFHGLGAGSDDTYAETENGKTFELSQAVEARYIRVYMHGSDSGTTNHVIEVEAFGTEKTEPADYTAVDEAIAFAESYNGKKDDYAGFYKLEQALDAVERGYDKSKQAAVNAMAKEILKAIASMEETTAKKDIASIIQNVPAQQESSKYTAESWSALQDALEAVNSVRNNPHSTKEELEAARDRLQEALSGLKDVSGKTETPGKPGEPKKIIEGQIYTVGNYKYKVTSLSQKTAEVAGTANAKLKKVTIGDTVGIEGQSFKVASIQASAFKGNKTITNAVIGKNVVKIGNSAFEKCSKLTKVTVKGNTLTTIGKKAFANCKKLKKVVIKSKKVKKVPKNAFKGIHKKAVVKIPKKK